MKLNHKELIIGIAIGSLLTAIPTIANTVYQATENAFNVTVNGKKAPLEGYNIGGYTYFKLRDIGEHVGFDVGFEDGTIMIDTGDDEVSDERSSVSVGSDNSDNEDGQLGYWDVIDEYLYGEKYRIIEQDGVKYVEVPSVTTMLLAAREADTEGRVLGSISICANSTYWWVEDNNIPFKKITEPCKAYMIGASGYMTYEQFETIIKPIINEILDKYNIPK